MTTNILIIGKNGQIANALIENFKLEKTDFNISVKDSSELDFSKPESLKENLKNLSSAINLIINCAGYTNVDKAEEEQELCDKINHQAVKILADFCKEKNILLIHYSTDYVFDGSGNEPFDEDNQENLQPLNYYGKTKLWAEQALKNSGCDYIIFRISWIYDNRKESKNFANTIKRLALEKEEINVVDDQIGSPTSADFVASNTIRFIKKITEEKFDKITGDTFINFDKNLINQIYHLNNGEYVSWHDFACKIIADLQKNSSGIILKKINKIPSSEYKTKAMRGLNSRLNNKKFFKKIAIKKINLHHMKLGITYNLFDGEELLEYSIQSVRNSADHINVVYQKISNWGEPCSENLEDLLSDLVKKKLIDKIYCYTPKNTSASKNELNKRNIGLNIAKSRFCSHFLNMDCDEFYHKSQFDEAKKFIVSNNIEASSCKFVNYIKQPTWQIQNASQTHIAFITKINLLSRLSGKSYFPVLVDPTRKMNGNKKFKYFDQHELLMEHMWLVRRDLNKKFNNSSAKKNIKPEHISEIINYQYPNKFFGNNVIEVDNIFNIKI